MRSGTKIVIYIFILVYLCVYYKCTCMYVHVRMCLYVCMYVHVRMCTYVCMYAVLSVCLYDVCEDYLSSALDVISRSVNGRFVEDCFFRALLLFLRTNGFSTCSVGKMH